VRPFDDARRFFDAIARRYDREYAKGREATARSVHRIVSLLPKGARVLDLGVGTGGELSGLLDAGLCPTGLDFSGEMLALCARRSRPVPLVRADLWEPLPFEDESFEGVIALHGTLAHPPHDEAPSRFAREAARVLGVGGVLAFEAPSPAWLEAADGQQRGDFVLRRSGAKRVVHEDAAAGAAIEALVLSADEWRDALAPFADVTITFDGAELFVIAKKRPPGQTRPARGGSPG
jgi:SAM-dependent methyltransferase